MARGALQMSLANLVDYLTQEEEDQAVPLSLLADAVAGGARQPLDLAFGEEAVTQAGQLAAATPGGVAQWFTEDIPAMAELGGDLAGAIAQPSTQRLQSGREAGAAARQGLSALADLIAQEGAMGVTRRGLEAMGEGVGEALDERGFAALAGPEDAIPGSKLLAALGMAAPVAKKSLFDIRPRVTKESLENPAVWRREGLREEGATTVEDQLPIERNVMQPEDLQGKVGIPFMGDRSRAGGQLTQVEGVPLSRPVALQGGEDYPLVTNPDAAWASNLGAARSRQNVAERAAEETGQAPVGVFTVMGERGIDFSTPVIESMMGQLESIRVPKKAIAKFDRRINDKIKTINEFNERPMQNFVGLNHPDAMDQILGVGDYPSVGAGELRKLLVQEMGMTEFRDIGFPVYHDVMRAVTKPELMPLQRGDAGTTMLRLDPEAPLSSESRHRTYTTAIPGGYLGGLEEAVPAQVMYPKGYEQMAGMKTKTGKPLSESDKIGWLGMSQHWEVFDQEWVDKVSEWLQSSEAKKGGAAMVLAPLFFGAAQLEQLEQE